MDIPGLNLAAVRQRAEELAKMGGGDSTFVYASSLLKENKNILCFRIVVDPKFGLDGAYWLDRKDFRINDKPYLNPSTVGLPDPFTPSWDVAKAKKDFDPSLKALVEAKNTKPEKSVLIPVVLYSVQGQLLSPDIKVLQCGVKLAQAIHGAISAEPNNINGNPVLLNPTFGKAVYMQKMGEGTAATYSVMPIGVEHALPAEVTQAAFDIRGKLKQWCKGYDHLKSLLENYLYGTPVIPDGQEQPQAAPVGAQPAQPVGMVYPTQQAPQAAPMPQQPMATPAQSYSSQAGVTQQTYTAPTPPTPMAPPYGAPAAPQAQPAQPARNVMGDLNNFGG